MSTSVNAAYGQKGKKFSHVSKLWAESGQMEKGVYKGVFSYIFKRLMSSLHFPFCHDSTCSLLTEDGMTRPRLNFYLDLTEYSVNDSRWRVTLYNQLKLIGCPYNMSLDRSAKILIM